MDIQSETTRLLHAEDGEENHETGLRSEQDLYLE